MAFTVLDESGLISILRQISLTLSFYSAATEKYDLIKYIYLLVLHPRWFSIYCNLRTHRHKPRKQTKKHTPPISELKASRMQEPKTTKVGKCKRNKIMPVIMIYTM